MTKILGFFIQIFFIFLYLSFSLIFIFYFKFILPFHLYFSLIFYIFYINHILKNLKVDYHFTLLYIYSFSFLIFNVFILKFFKR